MVLLNASNANNNARNHLKETNIFHNFDACNIEGKHLDSPFKSDSYDAVNITKIVDKVTEDASYSREKTRRVVVTREVFS